VGGFLTTAIQLLYLPNIALAALAYITGIGFSFGSGSLINGAHVTLGQVPALPFVAGLPTSAHPSLKYAQSTWVIVFLIFFLFVLHHYQGLAKATQALVTQGLRIFIVVAVVAFLSAGELLTAHLNPVGVIWWKFTATLAIAYTIAAVITLYIPAAIRAVAYRD